MIGVIFRKIYVIEQSARKKHMWTYWAIRFQSVTIIYEHD